MTAVTYWWRNSSATVMRRPHRSRIPDERDRAFWASTYPRYPKDAHHAVTNRLDRFLQPLAIRRLLSTRSAAAAASPGVSPPPGNVAFDALLLPTGGAELKQIGHQLQEAGLSPVGTEYL